MYCQNDKRKLLPGGGAEHKLNFKKTEGEIILKRTIMLLFFMLLMLAAMPVYAATPTTHWYKDWGQGGIDWNNQSDVKELDEAVRWELYVGYDDGIQIHSKIPGKYYQATLRFGNNITRGEFATALGRCLDIGNDNNFPWGRVDALVSAGIIPSKDGDFNAPITRAEMAQWMGKAAVKYNTDIKNSNVFFPDTSNSDILAAAKTGVIKGYPDGKFHPENNALRAHAALMLVRLSKQMNQDLPEDEELKQLITDAIANYNKMGMIRHDTEIQEGLEATDRMDVMIPNTVTLNEFKVVSKHSNTAMYWYSDTITDSKGKTFPGRSFGLAYAKKINGRWIITGEIATFNKY